MQWSFLSSKPKRLERGSDFGPVRICPNKSCYTLSSLTPRKTRQTQRFGFLQIEPCPVSRKPVHMSCSRVLFLARGTHFVSRAFDETLATGILRLGANIRLLRRSSLRWTPNSIRAFTYGNISTNSMLFWIHVSCRLSNGGKEKKVLFNALNFLRVTLTPAARAALLAKNNKTAEIWPRESLLVRHLG